MSGKVIKGRVGQIGREQTRIISTYGVTVIVVWNGFYAPVSKLWQGLNNWTHL